MRGGNGTALDLGGSISLKLIGGHLIEGDPVPGTYAVLQPDIIMAHDVTAPPAIDLINKHGVGRLKGADRTVLYLDHFTPPKDRESAEACRSMREFANRYGIRQLVEWGEGICHVHMFEGGMVKSGDLVIGADSHITSGGALGALCIPVGSTDLAASMTSGEFWLEVPTPLGILFEGVPDVWCEGKDIALRLVSRLGCGGGSGKVLELDGQVLHWLNLDSRMTIANMAAETSAVSAVVTSELKEHGPLSPDWNHSTDRIDLEGMGPQVALPGSPNRSVDVTDVSGQVVDEVFIGSCTNGRFEDLRLLSDMLRGRKVHRDVRLMVVPGSRMVFSLAEKAGFVRNITEAGGIVTMPTCGPCAGGFLGVLAEGEVAVSTSNRNFKGRMGEGSSKVYLSGVAVAAASAVRGVISHPSEVMGSPG